MPVSSGLTVRTEVLAGLGPFLLPVPVFPHMLGLSFPLFSYLFSPLLSGIIGYTGGGRKGNVGSVAR